MSKRWKPNNSYYIIDATGGVSSQTWDNDTIDEAYYEFGNCFETKEQAEAVASKVKALLLSLHSEPVTDCNQLPKLTEEVFDRPDCPEWAKYAAVNADGKVVLFSYEPSRRDGRWIVTYYSESSRTTILDDVTFDSTEWQNSLIEKPKKSSPKLTEEVFNHPNCPEWAKYASVNKDGRVKFHSDKTSPGVKANMGFYDTSNWESSMIERPVKVPDWCKVGAIVYDTDSKVYCTVDKICKNYVDLRKINTGDLIRVGEIVLDKCLSEARPRPYNAEEMQKLVGKVLEFDGNRDLVTSYDEDSEEIYADSMWMDADELLSNGYTIDGELCRVLEHFENNRWVR